MSRDIETDDRSPLERGGTSDRAKIPPAEVPLAREPRPVHERGYRYEVSPDQLQTLADVGRFRTVALSDLKQHRYGGQAETFREDLRSLSEQGLLQKRTAWVGANQRLPVAVLTKRGKAVLERLASDKAQRFHAGFVKPGEVAHDAAIYRMYQAERQKILDGGGRIRRVVLDYELKQSVYSPLAKARALPPLEYAQRQAEVARQNRLSIVDGKIVLPDLRIEYETSSGERSHVDLELATEHYHSRSLGAKAAAGFKMYAADGSAEHLSKVLEERGIVGEILSL